MLRELFTEEVNQYDNMKSKYAIFSYVTMIAVLSDLPRTTRMHNSARLRRVTQDSNVFQRRKELWNMA
jgi:hypothetical protein